MPWAASRAVARGFDKGEDWSSPHISGARKSSTPTQRQTMVTNSKATHRFDVGVQ